MPETVEKLYSNVGTEKVIADRLNIDAIVSEGFKQATVKYDALEILDKRQEVKELAKENIRSNFPAEYFEIQDIIITNIDFSENFKLAIEEKKTAVLVKFESSKKIDVIIPILHGPYGEDGTVQGLMELANIPYVGAGVLGSAVGMDKIIMKDLFKQAKLPIVKYTWFLSKEWKKKQLDILRRIEKELKYPMFVKPVNLGSSVGISKAGDRGASG